VVLETQLSQEPTVHQDRSCGRWSAGGDGAEAAPLKLCGEPVLFGSKTMSTINESSIMHNPERRSPGAALSPAQRFCHGHLLSVCPLVVLLSGGAEVVLASLFLSNLPSRCLARQKAFALSAVCNNIQNLDHRGHIRCTAANRHLRSTILWDNLPTLASNTPYLPLFCLATSTPAPPSHHILHHHYKPE
jgi:hypothetical protein